jgi:hypothetical protein
MLRKLESFACFLAALLALLIEGCFVYCMRICPSTARTAAFSAYGSQWISPTLPQCWLLGAVVALFYYLCRGMQSDPQRAVKGRRTFLRIWYWFLALASAQGCALYLNHFMLVRR